jgi:hypothetical protein
VKIQELKAEVSSSWETLNLTDGTPTVKSLFQDEIRKFGDLRRRSTWEKAAIVLESRWLLGGLENRDIIHYFCEPDTLVGKEYNQSVLDELLMDRNALERLKNGLENLYISPVTSKDREYAMRFLKRISGYTTVTDVLQSIALVSAA